VILIDANLLIYAHVDQFPKHQIARDWLDGRLNGSERVGLPWPSLLAFLRIVTNPRAFSQPAPMSQAWGQVRDWLSSPNAWIPTPTDRHSGLLQELLALPGIRADLVPDAHMAALAIEYGLMLCSTDGDFARFPGLRWTDPL
jgi:toxin-antitoxin system PIN domain toxin